MPKTTRALKAHLVKAARGQSADDSDDVRILDQHLPDSLVNKIGTNQNFFYYITQFDGTDTVSERGIGEIYTRGENHYLKRERAISYKHGSHESLSRPGSFFYFATDALVNVTTYIPSSYVDSMFSPFSVLCSIEENTPSPVELQDQTLLGRLDGRIQSIDKNELREILTDPLIVTALADTATPLNVKTGSLNLYTTNSTVSAHVLQVKPAYTESVKPKHPQRGSLIFNDEANCFEGYDGKRWRALIWES